MSIRIDGTYWEILPEDLRTHLRDFRAACIIAKEASNEDCDISYWQHQIDVIDRAKTAINRAGYCGVIEEKDVIGEG